VSDLTVVYCNSAWAAGHELTPAEVIGGKLRQAEQAGWLAIEAGHARPTEAGRRFNNDLVSLFL
jgi:hypothetical protein